MFHRLVKLDTLNEKTKILIAYKLSDAGLDVNVQNSAQKQTCLHLAVMAGLCDLAYCLLQNGADLTIVDNVITKKKGSNFITLSDIHEETIECFI